MYRNLFFDLDDTLWAFSANARATFMQMYEKYDYGRFFSSFDHFYTLYQKRNLELWRMYERDEVTKEELNRQRFLYPLEVVGAEGAALLSQRFSRDFFSVIPNCSRVMPYAHEVLTELKARGYRLYILSNGFEELQCHKMRSAGLDKYFECVILSDDIGVLKPRPEIFLHALAVTSSETSESLMIGDSWENDVRGARNVGMAQAYYNENDTAQHDFTPTFRLTDLRDLLQILPAR